MSLTHCSHEEHVVRAVLSGAWPGRCDRELTVHAATCEICSEVAEVSALLREDHDDARGAVQVPAAGQVWWRAAIRARLETAQSATQPMTWLHGLTAAITIGVMLAAVGLAWSSVANTAEWAKAVAVGLATQGDVTGAVVGALRQSLGLAVIAAACLVITPLALYFALSDD